MYAPVVRGFEGAFERYSQNKSQPIQSLMIAADSARGYRRVRRGQRVALEPPFRPLDPPTPLFALGRSDVSPTPHTVPIFQNINLKRGC